MHTSKNDVRQLERISEDIKVASHEDKDNGSSECDGCRTRILPLLTVSQWSSFIELGLTNGKQFVE